MKTVKLGAGMAFWGDSVRPAIEMVERADIDYLCCDHLAELTMSILSKQQQKDPAFGYTRDVLDLLRGHAECGCFVAINFHIHLRIGDQQIAGDVLQFFQTPQFGLQLRRVPVEFACIRALQRELVK